MNILARPKADQQVNRALKRLEYLPVNRNLRNSPIARGSRARVDWMVNKKGGWRGYSIPGAGIFLPLDCGIKRHATGFDVAMLLTLTGLSISRGPSKLTISNTEILQHMGLSGKSGYERNKVTEALKFWQHATVIWERWYTPNKSFEQKADKYDVLEIERPVLEASGGRVVLNKRWTKLATKYFQQIPGPLPIEASEQNLCLLVLGWLRGAKANGRHEKHFRSRREITKRIGLDHHERNLQFRETAKKLRRWFKARGGKLVMIERGTSVVFRYHLPEPLAPERERVKKSKPDRYVTVPLREPAPLPDEAICDPFG